MSRAMFSLLAIHRVDRINRPREAKVQCETHGGAHFFLQATAVSATARDLSPGEEARTMSVLARLRRLDGIGDYEANSGP